MRVLRPALLLFLLAALSLAYAPGVVAVTPFEYRDFGNASLPRFDNLVIKMDCNASTLEVYVKSGNYSIQGATVLLEVTSYAQPLIASGTTDASGFVAEHIPGNISLITGFFVLTVEEPRYEEREVHFNISNCFPQPPPVVYLPVTVLPPAPRNATPPGSAANVSQLNTTSVNTTANQTATGNETGIAGLMPVFPSCPLPLALFAALGVCCVSALRGPSR